MTEWLYLQTVVVEFFFLCDLIPICSFFFLSSKFELCKGTHILKMFTETSSHIMRLPLVSSLSLLLQFSKIKKTPLPIPELLAVTASS